MLHKHRAQSLLEALLSIALGVILIGGSVGLIGISLRSFNSVKQHLQANSLVRQTAEVIQSLTHDNWHNIYDLLPGVHYKPVKHDNTYVIQKGEEKIFDSQDLVSYWNFDEATSTIAYDNQSTNNGTLANGPTWQAESNCVSGSCLEFNGSNNYVDTALLDVVGDITVSFWMNPHNGSAEQVPVGNYNYSTSPGWLVDMNDPVGIYFGGRSGASKTWSDSGTTSYILNQWQHVVGMRSGTTWSIYINGVLKSSNLGDGGTLVSTKTVQFGRNAGGNNLYFDGLIDEPRIYNRALSADEIKTHYQADLDKLGLISYWAMDENGGITAYDNQSTNNGTLYNNPTWQVESNCISGSCLEFNGTNNYVSIPSVNPTTAITVEAWVKSASGSGYSGIWQIVSKYSAYILGTDSAGGKKMCFIIYDTTWQYNSCYTISNPEIWHHFVGTYDSSAQEKKIYVDGILRETTNPSGVISADTGPIHIAHRESVSVGSDHFNGSIDEVRIYSRALTADEISQRYQASYTKYFVTNKISRTSGTIDTTYNSANDDPSTLKINSVVKYGRGLVSQQTGGIADVRFYLTRSYNNQTFWQTDWSGGSGQTGPISNPGNKFDTVDSNINYASTTGSIYMTTPTSTVASLTSSILDTGVAGGAGFNSLLWQGSAATGGTVKFQIAFSNSSSTVDTYYGPTSTSDYYQPNPTVSIAFPTTGSASPQNKRYIRYKIYLSTASTTPQINDIIINWSP